MARKFFDVITVGDCKADHFLQLTGAKIKPSGGARPAQLFLPMGGKIPVSVFKFFPGGNALNAAVSFARFNLSTAVVAALGHDAEAERILKCVRSEGIARNFITQSKTASTPQTMILVASGERVIFGYGWQGNYLLPKSFPASWVYLTSLGKKFQAVYRKISSRKAVDRFRLAYNPGTRQLLSALPQVRRMIGLSDVVFLNLQEAQTVLRTRQASVKFLLRGLLNLGCDMAVVTDGGNGAACGNAEGFLKISAYPGRRIDATGAGDAFASGFLAGLIEDGMAEALRWGGVNATGEIGQIGVHTGLLPLDKMKKLLRMKKNYQPKAF